MPTSRASDAVVAVPVVRASVRRANRREGERVPLPMSVIAAVAATISPARPSFLASLPPSLPPSPFLFSPAVKIHRKTTSWMQDASDSEMMLG